MVRLDAYRYVCRWQVADDLFHQGLVVADCVHKAVVHSDGYGQELFFL
jgi:hypothetical protein